MTNADTFGKLVDELWDALGSGEWLEPGDYEALRERYNKLAEAAEVVCLAYRWEHPAEQRDAI